jgi:hypothetical protein
MKRFVEGVDRWQSTLFPASLDDYVTEDNPGCWTIIVRLADLHAIGGQVGRLLRTAHSSYDLPRRNAAAQQACTCRSMPENGRCAAASGGT